MSNNIPDRPPPAVYLIPSPLHESAPGSVHPSALEAVKNCRVFFVENERTARRFLKQIWKEMVIDAYEWYAIHKAEEEVLTTFRQKIREGISVGIISEAGCPGIADPGQLLIAAAQEMNAVIKPLVGPSSILLALMASGMNGQQFQFWGYLPIQEPERTKIIRELEAESIRKNSTQVFIETPYRNNQLISSLLKTCRPDTLLCLAVDLTTEQEWIRTKPVSQWKKEMPDIHKRPAIFCLYCPS